MVFKVMIECLYGLFHIQTYCNSSPGLSYLIFAWIGSSLPIIPTFVPGIRECVEVYLKKRQFLAGRVAWLMGAAYSAIGLPSNLSLHAEPTLPPSVPFSVCLHRLACFRKYNFSSESVSFFSNCCMYLMVSI
jgi:hypothetical protein